jgi:ABC transporter substrate binding protein
VAGIVCFGHDRQPAQPRDDLNSRRFPATSEIWADRPVTLPPGRARLATTLLPTGSATEANTIGITREHIAAGGLISYGTSLTDMFRRAGDLVDKVLRGTKPADIPVEQPTKFDLAVNLKIARTLGLDVPATVLARADEVIE